MSSPYSKEKESENTFPHNVPIPWKIYLDKPPQLGVGCEKELFWYTCCVHFNCTRLLPTMQFVMQF